MNTKHYFWVFFFLTIALFAQGEAALSFLTLHPVSPSIGKGLTGVSNIERDPLNFYYNPAKLSFFQDQNTFSFLVMPENTKWSLFTNIKYFSYGVSAGIDLKNSIGDIPLKLGIGFIRSGFDYGEIIVTSPESPDGLIKTHSKDASNNLSIGIGLDYKVHFGLGTTIKYYSSDFGTRYINGIPREISTDGFAFDFGAFVYAPISKLFLDDYKIILDKNSNLSPLLEASFGYSLLNVGGKVKYPFLEGEDPLPRNTRIGYSVNLGANINITGSELRIINYGFTAEADDILIQRNQNNSDFEYDNIFGKISFGKHLLKLNADEGIVVHKGHSLSLFETVMFNSGRYDGRGFPNYKTDSYGLSTKGVSKLINMVIENDVVKWITGHLIIEYYNINMFVDTSYETNLKGAALTITNISF